MSIKGAGIPNGYEGDGTGRVRYGLSPANSVKHVERLFGVRLPTGYEFQQNKALGARSTRANQPSNAMNEKAYNPSATVAHVHKRAGLKNPAGE